MTETRLGEQIFRYDREATAAVYERLAQGSADECKCSVCRNFVAQRATVYPASFKEFLLSLGIDPAKESEVWMYEYDPPEPRPVLYGGMHCFVGQMISGGGRSRFGESFEADVGSGFRGFAPGTVLAVTFHTMLPWNPPPEIDPPSNMWLRIKEKLRSRR